MPPLATTEPQNRRPHSNLLKYYVLESFLLGPLFPLVLIPRFFRFRTLNYHWDEQGITARWGILFRREISLDFERIQDIHLSSNLVERWLGLAKVQVQTASGSSKAELTVEGLQDFKEVRDFLYSRMRGVRAPEAKEHSESTSNDEVVRALHETAAELRALRLELEGRRTGADAESPQWIGIARRVVRRRLLTLLRVPERPDPPPGAGAEVETFRATRGFFRYSVLMWFPKQVAAFAGLWFSLAFFGGLDGGRLDFVDAEGMDRFTEKLADADIGLAWMRFELADIILFFEGLAVAAFVTQLVFTGLLLKLSWELRWYMVGERSLRIRHGLWQVREQTMTIANIQNMVVRQGPLQRFFGFSDLEVHTAGGGAGGSSGEDSTQQKDSFHVGRLRGLEDASGLRDKIRKRLQAVKAGEDAPPVTGAPQAASESLPDDLAAAARSLLDEARALRQSV